MFNASSKPVSFSRPKVEYFSNRPRILLGGDFNCILEASGTGGGINYSRELAELVHGLALTDTWLGNPTHKFYNHKQRILCITRTVKHNHILPISTVGIQLHVSVLYVDHFQVETFNLQISYTRCVGHLVGRGDGGTRSRYFNSGYRDPELLEVNFL